MATYKFPTILPKLIVFDLDDTIWYPEMYMLDGPPFKKHPKTKKVTDCRGEELVVHEGAQEAIRDIWTVPELKQACKIGYASRTEYKKWADTCLSLLEVLPGVNYADVASYSEIYPGRKTTHFKRMHELSGIAYEDMLFFDNERRNCQDVAPLGVVCVYTPSGMKTVEWHQGLEDFATSKKMAEKFSHQ